LNGTFYKDALGTVGGTIGEGKASLAVVMNDTSKNATIDVEFKAGDTAAIAADRIAAALNDANLGFSVQKDDAGAYQIISQSNGKSGTDAASVLTSITFTDDGTEPSGVTLNAVTIGGTPVAAASSDVKSIDISNAAGAQSAILVIDDAMKS